jgi:hypothetical protein
MSDRILSAFEKAMERFESRVKNLPAGHSVKLQYLPVGRNLAARYLHERDFNLYEALSNYTDPTARKYVLEGVEKSLLDNLTLPEDEEGEQRNTRVIYALYQVKEDKPALDQVMKELHHLLNHYRHTRDNAVESLKNSLIQRYRQINRGKLNQLPYAEQQRIHQEINLHFRKEKANLLQRLATQINPELERLKEVIKDIR